MLSTRSIKVCDFPVRGGGICGKEDVTPVTVSLGNKKGANDVCPQHAKDVEKAFASIGLPFTTARTPDSKNRKASKTASGKTFTAADARPWLIEQGLLAEDSRGRVAKDLMDQYAAAH